MLPYVLGVLFDRREVVRRLEYSVAAVRASTAIRARTAQDHISGHSIDGQVVGLAVVIVDIEL